MFRKLAIVLSICVATISAPSLPVQASTGCDTLEATLVSAIKSSNTLSPITNAASAYRSCLAKYSDSANSSYLYEYGHFYAIFTALNTYQSIGRVYALKAAADYRMALLGEESTVNSQYAEGDTCSSSYQVVLATALSMGDTSLASYAASAKKDCPIIRRVKTSHVEIEYDSPLKVGSTVSAYTTNWPSSTYISYQWFRGNTGITGAIYADYEAKQADVGQVLSVRVTGTGAQYAASRDSDDTEPVTAATLTVVSVPRITGDAKVGMTLQAVPGQWDSGVNFSYSWLRDGAEIPGETSSKYTLLPSDVGRQISVSVTGVKAGYTPAARTSSSARIASANFTQMPVPSISGSAKVSSTLKVVTGAWNQGTALSYQWMRNGAPISKATGAVYKLVKADLGKTIKVAVTGTKPGFNSVTKTSASTAKVR